MPPKEKKEIKNEKKEEKEKQKEKEKEQKLKKKDDEKKRFSSEIPSPNMLATPVKPFARINVSLAVYPHEIDTPQDAQV